MKHALLVSLATTLLASLAYSLAVKELSDTQTECLARRNHSWSQTNKARSSDAAPREFGSLLSRFAVKVKQADDYR